MTWGRIDRDAARASIAASGGAAAASCVEGDARTAGEDIDAAPGSPVTESPLEGAARGASRAQRAASDAAIASSAAEALGHLANPHAVLMMLQSRLRDAQVGQREHDVRASETRADVQRAALERALERASSAEAARAESEQIGDVFRGIAAGLALVAGAASAVFTGGAGLVAAVGIAIAVLGPVVTHELARAHVVDGQAELVASVTCAVVGAALSFGAGAAAGGVSIAGTAASAAVQGAQLAAATAAVAQGGCQVAAGVFEGDHLHAVADARGAEVRRDAALEELDAAAAAVRVLLRRFDRVAARMEAVARAEGEARRAAGRWRA